MPTFTQIIHTVIKAIICAMLAGVGFLLVEAWVLGLFLLLSDGFANGFWDYMAVSFSLVFSQFAGQTFVYHASCLLIIMAIFSAFGWWNRVRTSKLYLLVGTLYGLVYYIYTANYINLSADISAVIDTFGFAITCLIASIATVWDFINLHRLFVEGQDGVSIHSHHYGGNLD